MWTTAISCEAPWPHALALAMSAPPPDVALLSALHGKAPSWAATLQWLRGAKECHLEANASWQNMGIQWKNMWKRMQHKHWWDEV